MSRKTFYVGNLNIPTKLPETDLIGKGGEADIYDLRNGFVAKIFKDSSHPDFNGMSSAQKAADLRIAEHQKKLPLFPKNTPRNLIGPKDLIYNSSGNICGYTMPFLTNAEVIMKYGTVPFRKTLNDQVVIEVLQSAYSIVKDSHDAGFIAGDYNDLNILVKGKDAYQIDADSGQFGGFKCSLFTLKFVDPTLCNPSSSSLELYKPHNELSDWYAFSVMTMQTLLCLSGGPYGGVYNAPNGKAKVPHSARPLHRITVFDKNVVYPKVSIHFKNLTDELLQYFSDLFVKDKREVMPKKLLNLTWQTCTNCGAKHVRTQCPTCVVAQARPTVVTVKHTGKVSGNVLFRTSGTIVSTTMGNGKILFLTHRDGKYFREENPNEVFKGDLDPKLRFRLFKEKTIVATEKRMFVFNRIGEKPDMITVDNFNGVPVIDTGENGIYYVQDGNIKRLYTEYGNFNITADLGSVIPNQTFIWTGNKFGFGFFRAEALSQCFIFNTTSSSINTSIALNPFIGQLVDATSYFTDNHIWFFTTNVISGKKTNFCFVFNNNGEILASSNTEADDGSWLGTIRNKVAMNDFLLSATDSGLIRVRPNSLKLIDVEKIYPDTDKFVDSGSHLYFDQKSLLVVGSNEIWAIETK